MSDSKRIERIEDKVDALGQKLGSIDVTLAKQHESLREHMRRTELLELEMTPVKKHVAMVAGAFKFIGLIAVIAGIAESVLMVVQGVLK